MNSRRCEQDSNLRGETPLDFKSNALTTRPSQPNYLPTGQSLYLNNCTVVLQSFTFHIRN